MTLEDVLRNSETVPAVRRWLFEQLAAGTVTEEQALSVARRIGVELAAESYAIAVFDLPHKEMMAAFFSDPAAAAREALYAYFLKYAEYMPVQLSPDMGAVLIMGASFRMAELTERCIRAVEQEYERIDFAGWHMAVSGPAAGLEDLPSCYRDVDRLWSMRHFRPERRVFRPGDAELPPQADGDVRRLDSLSPALTGSAVLEDFLAAGRDEDIPVFTAAHMAPLSWALVFLPFRHYVLLSARFAAERYLAGLGIAPEQLGDRLPGWETAERDPSAYLAGILTAALSLRDGTRGDIYPGALGRAVTYVRQRLTDPALSLPDAAGAAGVSPSHLSVLFRRTMDRTFTQYVTEKRLELACSLLRKGKMSMKDISAAAGFRDSRYFSTVFKKYYGLSPTAYGERKNGTST